MKSKNWFQHRELSLSSSWTAIKKSTPYFTDFLLYRLVNSWELSLRRQSLVLSSWARKQKKGSSRKMEGTEEKIWLGDGLIWLGTHPASRGSFCLPKGESKRKAFLARWRVLKKNLGDLWLRLIWLETDPASRGCFCPPERGSKRKALLAGWRVLRKNMIGLPVVLTFSRLPISRTFKGNRKKVRVIGSSKKIAGSKEKKTLLTAQQTFFIEMLSENWKILLDYKSERYVTKHCINRAFVLLFMTSIAVSC